MNGKLWIMLGAILAGLAVASGAFGAHLLKDAVKGWYPDEALQIKRLGDWETAARYQMYHALALLAVAWAVNRWPASGLPAIAGWLFVAGVGLFSGSLYLMAFTGQRWLGAVTPLGGAAFLAGWLCLIIAAWRAA